MKGSIGVVLKKGMFVDMISGQEQSGKAPVNTGGDWLIQSVETRRLWSNPNKTRKNQRDTYPREYTDSLVKVVADIKKGVRGPEGTRTVRIFLILEIWGKIWKFWVRGDQFSCAMIFVRDQTDNFGGGSKNLGKFTVRGGPLTVKNLIFWKNRRGSQLFGTCDRYMVPKTSKVCDFSENRGWVPKFGLRDS
eukprot:sb/3471116/